MKKKCLVIHIPHSSLKLSKIFKDKCLLDKDELKYENLLLTDLYTNRFFNRLKYTIIRFKYSRLFCDVEKFKDDSKEVMSKVGMGVIYTKTLNKDKLIDVDEEYRNFVISKYYDKYHERVDNLVNRKLSKFNKCFILDFHSFSDLQVSELLGYSDTCDICIGIDDFFSDKRINKFTYNFFKKLGYNVKYNYPYKGTYINNEVFNNRDKRVKSIMLEINKKLYVNDKFKLDKNKFYKLKKDINNYVKLLNKYNEN